MIALNESHYREQAHLAQAKQESLPWLMTLQQEALEQLLAQGLPNTRVEDWKYTNLKPLTKKLFTIQPASEQLSNITLPANAQTLVFNNGHFQQSLSSLENTKSISYHVLSQDTLDIKPDFTHELDDIVATLNTALLTDGLILTIKENSIIDTPIHIYHINTAEQGMSHLNHHIILEKNSEATIVEHHLGDNDNNYLSTIITNVHCFDNAKLKHYKIQCESMQAYHLASVRSRLRRDSQLQQFKFDFGSRLARTNNSVSLEQTGAYCQLSGLYITRKQQHIDNHTMIDHQVANTNSDEFYKGIIDDRSRAVFNGSVIVRKDAQKINACQSNKNLLLSEHAEIDTKPQLEIYADDVKCTHGATVGQLDEDALFFLSTRGIDKETARNVLTFGFAKDILQSISHEELRLNLEQLILAQLHLEHEQQELL